MKIYVGNLQYDTTEEELRELFGAKGQVESVAIVRDRDTQRPKGFGFVEMPSPGDAQTAIAALNGQELRQRRLIVNEARPQEARGFSNRGSYRPSFRNDKGGPAKRSERPRR